MKVLKTMFRAFLLGLGVGILLAPRSGDETRRMLKEKVDGLLEGVDSLTNKLDQSGAANSEAGTAYVPNQHYTESTAAREVGSANQVST